jgi:glycine cleavage system H protein
MQLVPGPRPSTPCIWMSAGLIRYKLCSRELDCEHCPLDAALRGDQAARVGQEELAASSSRAIEFPADRKYSSRHWWVQPASTSGAARLGLDALATALLGAPTAVVWAPGVEPVALGDALCTLDLPFGALTLTSPLAGGSARPNPALEQDPSLIVTSPYGEGWLTAVEGAVEGPELVDASAIRQRSSHDLRRFRRRVALHLLAELEEVGPTLADGGRPLTDLRRMLGPRRYLALIQELVS